MKKYILAIGAVVVASILLSGCVGLPSQPWTWELMIGEDGWNEVTFTQEQIDCCSSDSPVDVLSSISDYWSYVFEDGTYTNYHNGHAGNSLHHIQPGILYFVHVIQDCTLTINKC